MQRLVKNGYLNSSRGPKGGFSFNKKPTDVSLLEIYECIEGPIEVSECHMEYPICPFEKCLMGNIVQELTLEFKEYLHKMKVSDYI
jgi:Rrf2 family protein